MLFNSKIRLGEDLFNEIISHPVLRLLDMNTLKALKRSTLGLDLYGVWRLSKNPRWTPHLLLGIRLAHRANRACRAGGPSRY